jgi:hypothetical protein
MGKQSLRLLTSLEAKRSKRSATCLQCFLPYWQVKQVKQLLIAVTTPGPASSLTVTTQLLSPNDTTLENSYTDKKLIAINIPTISSMHV